MIVINGVLLGTLVLVMLLWGFNWLSVWAGVPLLVAAVLSEIFLASSGGDWWKASGARRFGILGMVVGVVVPTLFFHLTLYLGPSGADSSVAEGGQKFMVYPLFAFLGGALGFTLGGFYGMRGASNETPPSAPPS